MPLAVYINGKSHDCLAVENRAIHYGDGLFETILVKNAQIQLLDQHLERLQFGIKQLCMAETDSDQIKDQLNALANQFPNSILKLIVSVSQQTRGYLRQGEQKTDIIVFIDSLPKTRKRQLAAQICTLRLAAQPRLAGVKHLNRLEQVLASNELKQGFDEGILFLYDKDVLVETISGNIFIVKSGKIMTPKLDQAGVEGVAKAKLMQIAFENDIEIMETFINKETLLDADGVFISNSIMGLREIVSIDKKAIRQDKELFPLLYQVSKKYFVE